MKHLDRVDVRSRLAVRRDPYWHRLAEGRYVGFRKLTPGTPGTWLARAFNLDKKQGGKNAYDYETLGDFGPLEERRRFDAAKAAAEEWFKHLDQGGTTDRVTVKSACESYAAKLRREKSEAAAVDAEGTFRRLVVGDPDKTIDPDPIAKIELQKLKPSHMTAWRERIFELGSRSYFNRNLTPVRAALNLAYDERKVASDFAWSKALRPLKLDQGEGRRTLYLDPAQRRKLIEKASDEFKPLLIAWNLLPRRPGDVAKLRVEHLDIKQRALRIQKGKTGSYLIPLTAEAFAHFKECAKSKLPGAWLVSRADGGQWKKEAWRDEMWEAVKAAKLPRATVAYTLRHSTITDLVTGGLDIFTVAKLSGTSVAMIDKHYGQLQQEHARKALEKLSLM